MLKFSQDPIEGKIAILRREAEERDAKRRAKNEGLPYLDIRNQAIDRSALELITEELAKEARAVVLEKDRTKVAVAAYTSESNEFGKLTLLLEEKKLEPKVSIVSISSLREAMREYASVRVEEREEIVSEIKLSEEVLRAKVNIKSIATAKEDIAEINIETSTTDTLVRILADAIILKSSDIHVEAGKDFTTLRFRVDGVLYDVAKLPSDIHRRLIGRLKLLSNLKLNVKDRPQDGRFTIRRASDDVEVRLSVAPTEHGESVVMRVLDPETISFNLSDLGLRADDEKLIRGAIKEPNGMVLVAGPTGSGKTTSLYAFLKANQSSETKTITIEDPIEYHLEGVEQTQVHPEDGYTFVSGLRSALRQDPDVILIGEIRDKETASTAIDAALTGHLVFSTLHTNSAAGAIPRLIDLEVRPDSLTPAINLIIAQRLVRKLCDKCKKKMPLGGELADRVQTLYSSLPERAIPKVKKGHLYQKCGCEYCEDGFSGRTGIFELLVIDEAFEDIIGAQPSENKIRKHARGKGAVSMQEDGILKALGGITTLEEIEKVTGSIKWPEPAVE